ncbi:hypothetical protein GOV05_05450 [Candidatus Woesearchaeota archaeon]|nr:hypothetical protein [Candidatus Woesearchaeota archaeon]
MNDDFDKRTYLLSLIPLSYITLFFLRIKKENTPFLSHFYNQINTINEYANQTFIEIIRNSRITPFNLTEYLLSRISLTQQNTELLIIFFSLTLLMLITYAYIEILKELRTPNKTIILSTIILLITPSFISQIFFLNSTLISIFLAQIGFLLFLKNRNRNIALLLFVFSLFFWRPITFFLIFFSYAYYDKTKSKKQKTLMRRNLIYLALLLIFYYFIFIFPNILPSSYYFLTRKFFSKITAVFGNLFGYSLPILLLSSIGFSISWFSSKKNFWTNTFLLIAFLLSTYFNNLILPLTFFISFFAAKAINNIASRKWELEALRNVTLFIIFCLVLLSTSSYIKNISNNPPSMNEQKVLVWMKQNNHQGIVLSLPKNTPLITYHTNNPGLIIDKEIYREENLERYSDLINVFFSRNLEETTQIFDKHNIGYVYVTNEMKNGEVWNRKDQGLLFLLKNSETFKNIFYLSGVELWRYQKNETG